jgi:hypothetical protein
MRSPIARLYALSAMLILFFVSWALVAARPWGSSAATKDSRLAALAARERRLQAETLAVRRLVAWRWSAYRVALARRKHAIAAAERRIAAAAQGRVPVASAQRAASSTAPSLAAPAPPVIRIAPVTATRTS